MLAVAEAKLKLPDGEILNQSMGSVMHGVLAERMNPAFADKMHQNGLHPYTQCLYVKEKQPIWRITVMSEEAFNNILVPAMKMQSVYLKQRQWELQIESFSIKRITQFQDLEREIWIDNRRLHHINIGFLTSTSFKTNGIYAVFPEPRLCFKGLVKKWNAFSTSSLLEEPDLADKIADNLSIADYNLHMHPYSLEGRRIRAFRGNMRFGFFANDTIAKLAAMLCEFADFSGIGIKTALGMGAITSELSYYREDSQL